MHSAIPAARRVCSAVSALGVIFLAASARADVKIISEVTVTRQPDNGSVADPQTVTTFYKGRRARVEVTGGSVTLYNADSDRVYTLDLGRKTYYVLPVKQVQEGQTDSAAAESEGANLDVKLDLKSPDGAETRTISGLVAKEYNVSGSISVKPRERGGGGLFGGFPSGGGGFPGGGFPGGGSHHGRRGGGRGGGQGGRQSPATQITGEVWLSDAAKLPDDKKVTALPTARLLLVGDSPALNPLTDSLNKKKLLPLYSRITLTRPARRARGADEADGGQGTQASPEQTVTTAVQVKSFSQEALDDSLFLLPSGYTQVDPPLPLPRGGG